MLTVGAIKGGIRNNIIPDEVELIGTLRTFDPACATRSIARMRRTAENIAAASGATAEVDDRRGPTRSTCNDPALTAAHAAVAGARGGRGQGAG